jgi:hypothetical protein
MKRLKNYIKKNMGQSLWFETNLEVRQASVFNTNIV